MACWDGGFAERPEGEREGEAEWLESTLDDDEHAEWRGDVHVDDSWPEHLAGPEYWGGKGDGDLTEKYPPDGADDEEGGP